MPLALCAIESGKDGTAVVRTAGWLWASGFDVTFACLIGPPLEPPLRVRVRSGTAQATIPEPASAHGVEALDALALATDTIRASGLRSDADVHVIGGRRKRALDRLAVGLGADLVVAGDGRWGLTDACPTLVVPPAGLAPRDVGPIICAFGDGSMVAARAAARLALLLHRPLIVAHVLAARRGARRDDVQRTLDALTGSIRPRVRRQAVVVEGAMPRALVTLAEDTGADFIVLGRPRPHGLLSSGCLARAVHVWMRSSRALVFVPRGQGSGRIGALQASRPPGPTRTMRP